MSNIDLDLTPFNISSTPAITTMLVPARSTRNSVPPGFPEEVDALTSFIEDKTLTPKSRLDEFRRFFDFKSQWWNKFHRQLKEHVLVSSTWADVQNSETKREAVAAAFLEQVGSEYWGKENQEKYLLEDHIAKGLVCVYPRHQKAMIKALAFLLEKNARNRRESVSQDIPETRSASGPLSDPPHSEMEIAGSVKISSSRASTPTSLLRIPTPPKAAQTPRSKRIRSVSMVRDRAFNSPALSTPTPSFRGRTTALETALVSPAPGALSSQQDLQLYCQEHMGPSKEFFTQFSNIPPNTLATCFLVQEEGSQDGPVCVPFQNFEDYPTTDEFLNAMEKKCCYEHEPSRLQLFENVPQFSRAAISLQWSEVSFVMRRETDDLKSLANRIGCAWRAKEQGELQTFEFVIRVTLKRE